jgi:hypothetical protein
MSGLERLDLRHTCLFLRTKFYKHLNEVSNDALNKLHCIYGEFACKSDISFSLAQLSYCVLKQCIYKDFYHKCNFQMS